MHVFKVTEIKAFRYMNLFKKNTRQSLKQTADGPKQKSVFYCIEVVDAYKKVEKLLDEPL